MKLRNVLLGTTAVFGAGLLTVAAPSFVQAQEVTPGGALNVTITGFARFLVAGGDLDEARLSDTVTTGLDFRNDTEVHVVARGKHETTGIEYGATVEFEADTNRNDNTDETWVFLRGGFGEVRFGDEDGPLDNSAIGGFTVAAGTGGIDGTVVDAIGTGVVKPFNSGDDTKIRYYTPSFGGFQVGVSYTPNDDGGDNIASKNVSYGELVEGAAVYTGDFGDVGIKASVVGAIGELKNQDDDDLWSWGAGASADVFGFKVGGGYFSEKVGEAEKDFFNLGVGAALGPANVSVSYGQVIDIDQPNNQFDKPYNLVFSADVGLMPGVVLAGDVGFFDNDLDGDSEFDGDGWQAVGRLGVAF